MGLIPNQLNNKTMNPYIIQSSLYLSTIYEAIIAKQEILRVKMQQYNNGEQFIFIIKFETILNIFIRAVFWENETEQVELNIIILLHFNS